MADKKNQLSNRAYVGIGKKEIVRFKKVMEKPREIFLVPELEKALDRL
jgi:hypothetical protein